jgi:hypothetical protein
LYSGTNEYKKGYQARTNIVNDEKGDMVIDYHRTFASWRKYFSKLLNVHVVKDVSETEKHAAEPLLHEPLAFEF